MAWSANLSDESDVGDVTEQALVPTKYHVCTGDRSGSVDQREQRLQLRHLVTPRGARLGHFAVVNAFLVLFEHDVPPVLESSSPSP